MSTKIIDISARRRRLYKRKRRKKIFFQGSLLLTIIMLLFFTLIKVTSNINNSTASNPILAEDIEEESLTVCIDPGHGDFDIGTEGITGAKEKDITLKIALKLGRLLEKNNIKVIYTRTNDRPSGLASSNDSLKERIKISEIFNCDLFISLHCNSDEKSENTKGVETWYNPDDPASNELATFVQGELANLFYTDDRGLKTYASSEDALAVLEKNTATSILIELGFLSNDEDEFILSSNRGQNECAEYITKGILKYKDSN